MKLATRIKITIAIAVTGIIVTGLVSHSNVERISETRKLVEHTHQVIIEQEGLNNALRELESNARGFAATGNDAFLRNDRQLREQLKRHFDRLVALTADNDKQKENLARLEPMLTDRSDEMRNLIDTRQKSGFDAAVKKVRLPMSDLDAALRSTMNEIRKEEERLLELRTAETLKTVDNTEIATASAALASLVLIVSIAVYVVSSMNRSIRALFDGTERVISGDLQKAIEIPSEDEFGVLSRNFNLMLEKLKSFDREARERDWMKSNLNRVNLLVQGHRDFNRIGQTFLNELAPLVDAHHAVLYKFESDDGDPGVFRRLSTYAAHGGNGRLPAEKIAEGEGLIGQCARNKSRMVLRDVSAQSFVVTSGLIESSSSQVIIQPILFEDQVKGVVELATLGSFKPIEEELVGELATAIGVALQSVEVNLVTEELLKESQQLNEELQAQQEELETQQEELRRANEDLEEKAEELDMQNQEISDKNVELEQMQLTLEERANELSLASRYKSEFLANMSHDLRTPLNSLMIFSELLASNDEGNLQPHQVEYAKNSYLAGRSLLSLVDDILDLSKIESGTVALDVVQINVRKQVADVKVLFDKIAEERGLVFTAKIDEGVPEFIRTDEKRFMQVLNNLLSNAFKFTETGGVSLEVSIRSPRPGDHNYRADDKLVSFAVSDTGIGIPEDKHGMIFEAFRQADPKTKGKYGGTGLGLAICRELSELLGGYIELISMPDKGSTFTFVVPPSVEAGSTSGRHAALAPPLRQASVKSSADDKLTMQTEIADDRQNIKPGDRVMVLIEDDPSFAAMLLDAARQQDFKGLVALRGAEGLALARRFVPDGITLDLRLPDMDGWVVLDQLKSQPETRHIPVHIISVDEHIKRGMELGAIGFLEKPVTLSSLNEAITRIRSIVSNDGANNVLIAESDDQLRTAFDELLTHEEARPITASSGSEALEKLGRQDIDCLVTALELQDMSGMELIERMQTGTEKSLPPVIVYGSRDFTKEEKEKLKLLKESGIVKDVNTPERLLSEVVLFMHRVEASLPEAKRKLIAKARQQDDALTGKKILIVDDDPRNISALKGALQRHELNIITADNGLKALETLEQHPDVDLVLMDIMMPEMDGYEATREIRKQARFTRLPVIAVTAKAMKEDRRKCLEAGASDYISKPVDRSQLLSLMRVWLYESKRS